MGTSKKPQKGWFTCLPEVRDWCGMFCRGLCDGSFDSDCMGCLIKNRAVLLEQARKEAAGYGVKDADHSGPI